MPREPESSAIRRLKHSLSFGACSKSSAERLSAPCSSSKASLLAVCFSEADRMSNPCSVCTCKVQGRSLRLFSLKFETLSVSVLRFLGPLRQHGRRWHFESEPRPSKR